MLKGTQGGAFAGYYHSGYFFLTRLTKKIIFLQDEAQGWVIKVIRHCGVIYRLECRWSAPLGWLGFRIRDWCIIKRLSVNLSEGQNLLDYKL